MNGCANVIKLLQVLVTFFCPAVSITHEGAAFSCNTDKESQLCVRV